MVTGTPYTPPVTRATFRRSARGGVVAGVVLLAVAVPFGQVPYGLFGCVGIALGILNIWLVVQSVARLAGGGSFTKARFSGSVFARIAVITVIAFACAVLFRPAGIAVFGGLALFQILATVSAALPLIKEIRQR